MLGMHWHSDGVLTLTPPGASPATAEESEPLAQGKWFINDVVPEENESAEQVKRRNDEHRYVMCHRIDALYSGRAACFDVYQTSRYKDETGENELPTQGYRFRREGEVETISFVITQN